jgi:hypothetical protein
MGSKKHSNLNVDGYMDDMEVIPSNGKKCAVTIIKYLHSTLKHDFVLICSLLQWQGTAS